MTAGVSLWVGEVGPNDRSRFLGDCLARHMRADWGDLDLDDRQANDRAVVDGGRILSRYVVPAELVAPDGVIYVIKEWDRSATTILFESEY